MSNRFFLYIIGVICVTIIGIGGCSNSTKDKKTVDTPKKVTYSSEDIVIDDEETDTIKTELYLMDNDGLIIPTSYALPNTESIAKQALEYLVQDGPVVELLPDGLQGILPAETVINSIDVQDETAIVDFSKEFAQYDAQYEEQILQSLVWTLTQFDSINSVILRIDGHEITEMPVGSYNIPYPADKSIGINKENNPITDIMNTKSIVLYFEKITNDSSYLVPVTRRIDRNISNIATAIIQELAAGPQIGSMLTTDFSSDVTVNSVPSIENGIVSLDFDEGICINYSKDEIIISEQLLSQLVMSLTEQGDIDLVHISVNGMNDLLNESGNKLVTPVARPVKFNMENL